MNPILAESLTWPDAFALACICALTAFAVYFINRTEEP
jgi:hypothetical protein